MRKIRNIALSTFFIFCLFLFKPRQDVVLTAIDETQYIRLYEAGQDFEIGLKDSEIFTGTYTLSRDTIYLIYREYMDYTSMNQVTGGLPGRSKLPQKLFINKSSSRISSTEDHSFTARIHMDMRQNLEKNPGASILASRPDS